MQCKVFSTILLTALLVATLPLYSKNDDSRKIIFSGGAPHEDYQPSVIIPILKEAFKRNGYEFSAQYYPSLRSLLMSNSGNTDGELHRVYEFEKVSGGKYNNLIRVESKLLSIWLSAFSKKNLKIQKWSDLKNLKVVYYRGRKNVESFLKDHVPKNQISRTVDDQQAFEMLAQNRVDVAISESRAGKNIISSKASLNKIKEVGKLKETLIYSYMHKKHKTLADKVAKTLEQMKSDGTFKQIINSVNDTFK